jgi:3-dehydroquinate dehydratase type I
VKAKICVSLLPKNIDEAKNLIKEAEEQEADLIELRLDYLDPSINLNSLSRQGSTPKIATILHNQGIIKNKSQSNYQELLIKAAKSGFEYVDIAIDSVNQKKIIKEIKAINCKPIVSFHDFDSSLPLSDLEKILEKEISIGAEVCKIVTTARRIQDNLEILNFISKHSSNSKMICFCMGNLGRISRVLSPLFGGFFTFASLKPDMETANGQLSIQELKEIYKLLE